MAGHSPSKTGVKRPYVPVITSVGSPQDGRDARHRAGTTLEQGSESAIKRQVGLFESFQPGATLESI